VSPWAYARWVFRQLWPHRVPGYPGVRFRGAPPVVEPETGRRLSAGELARVLSDLVGRAHVENGPEEREIFKRALRGVRIEWVPGPIVREGFSRWILGLWKNDWVRVVTSANWPAVLAHELRHEGLNELFGDPDAEHRTWGVDVERVESWLGERWK